MVSIIQQYGYNGDTSDLQPGCQVGRILGTWGDYYRVICEEGEGIARKKASAYLKLTPRDYPTTGDFVSLKWNPHGESRIFATLPRFSKFERATVGSDGRTAQLIAVNFNTLFFLTSANQNFNVRRLERFLSCTQNCGSNVVILLTKCDLVDATTREKILNEARNHSANSPVLPISTLQNKGLDALSPYVQPRQTLAFVGSSGVGKSSLVNALAGEELMPTFEIREWDAKGRHTTTERELVMLPNGTMVIDTPGMREIALIIGENQNISEAFPDIETLTTQCRFSDCRHQTEPGCAIKAALTNGTITPERFQAYLRLKAEITNQTIQQTQSRHRYRK